MLASQGRRDRPLVAIPNDRPRSLKLFSAMVRGAKVSNVAIPNDRQRSPKPFARSISATSWFEVAIPNDRPRSLKQLLVGSARVKIPVAIPNDRSRSLKPRWPLPRA